MLDQITPLILTLDEAPNLARTLAKLSWARRIVVIDSGSTDGTLEFLGRHPKVEAIHHPFADAASQCNFGLSQISSPWVLSLDADYELSSELIAELAALNPADHIAGYRARFVYRIHGRPLRGTVYPPRTVLYRRDKAVYHQEGHTQRVQVGGEILPLGGVIYHDDRKPLGRWLASQRHYASAEAEYLLGRAQARLPLSHRMRLMSWPAPLAVPLYALFVKGCLFNGWPGWYYALQRCLAETLIALELIDRRLRGGGGASANADDIGPTQ